MISHACPVDHGVPVRGLSYFHAWTVWTIDLKEENNLLLSKNHSPHRPRVKIRQSTDFDRTGHGGPHIAEAKRGIMPHGKE